MKFRPMNYEIPRRVKSRVGSYRVFTEQRLGSVQAYGTLRCRGLASLLGDGRQSCVVVVYRGCTGEI
jgi:hypothetical protein